MTIETTVSYAEKCPCENGYYVDRYIDEKKGCPACDPTLGNTPEARLEVYRKLISPPSHYIKVFHDNRLHL